MNKFLAVLFLAAALLRAQDARRIMQEVQDRARAASQRYEGTLKVIDSRNKVSEKRWTYDRIGSAGSSKVVIRFSAPAEVKGVALLVVNHPERSSDQWMWTPALQRDRRIAFQDRSTRFFGTDFSFEDLEERDSNQYDYRILGEETVNGAPCWKLESRPKKSKSSQYTHAHIWVDKARYIFEKIESFHAGKLIRRLIYGDYRRIQNIWTPLTMEIEEVGRKSKTILHTEKLQYNVPMKDEQFTLQALRRES
ncbi:MAG: outer membrane lipoprotein-sorting protein [Bryobacterales bacterium]|nr:outer membrane lipoprotein-sorting protein [Bryobacterales bacterium]